MTQTKLMLRALQGETLETPPIWLMRQAGRYLPEYRQTRTEAGSFLDLCYNPELAVEVTLQPLRRYAFDAAILFSDILVVPQALGQGLAFKEGEGPVLPPIRDLEGLRGLSLDNLHRTLDPVYKTVSGLSTAIPETTTLIGFAGAPWTIATYMVEGKGSKDYQNTKRWAYAAPDEFQQLIDLVVEATSQYLIKQVEAGAEVLQLFDTWAGVLPENEFRRWVIQPAKKIIENVHKVHPAVPVIGFPRGAGMLYPEYIDETGVAGVGMDTTLPLEWAKQNLQSRCAVQGNLDPIMVVTGGQAMVDGIKRILDTFSGGPFIFNLGHGIIPPTPPENVDLLVKTIRGA